MNFQPVLYAEDDENDVFFMQRAFKRANIPNPLCVVTDGKLAVDYLAGNGAYSSREQFPMPCLVLLDLKMPEKSGLEVLEWFRGQPGTATVPVVMFTSSNQDSDMQRAFHLGATDYLIKPGRPDELSEMVRKLKERFLNSAS